MMLRRLAYLVVVGALMSMPFGRVASAASGPWTGIVAAARAIDWSAAGVRGGIPAIGTKCGATLASSSTQSQINAAISSCSGGGGGYVLLGPGTFNLAGPPILKSNVE